MLLNIITSQMVTATHSNRFKFLAFILRLSSLTIARPELDALPRGIGGYIGA